jgi:hypothetical protein
MNDNTKDNPELPYMEEAENLSIQEAFRKFIEKLTQKKGETDG